MKIPFPTTLLLLTLLSVLASAQQESVHKSIHQRESEFHACDPASTPGDTTTPLPLLSKTAAGKGIPARMVYGWHPYWLSQAAHLSYDYSALTHIAFFSYETDTATGKYTTVRGWDTTPLISYAHQQGVKVTLTVTNFGYDQNDKLLGDTVKQEQMITALITLLKSRNGDGVNFDLEMIRNTQRVNLVKFIRRAATRIRSELPGAEISMATPAVDWSGTWDFAQLAGICDYLIVMGYDYYWSGSTTAGPVAPLEGENYNVTRTIDTYLAAGVPRERLILGVPWFGHDWPVSTGARKSPATGAASSRTYTVAEQMAISYGKVFDQTTKVPWISYMSGTAWRQVWYDDSLSLALKYALVNTRSLAGIGIWALGYDGGRPEIWNGITAGPGTSCCCRTTPTRSIRQQE
jgi:spore germination protein